METSGARYTWHTALAYYCSCTSTLPLGSSLHRQGQLSRALQLCLAGTNQQHTINIAATDEKIKSAGVTWLDFLVCCCDVLSYMWIPKQCFPKVKGAHQGLNILKSLALISQAHSSFVIRVSLVHPLTSLFLYGIFLSIWYFPVLVNFYFQVSFKLKVILCAVKITQSPMTALL